MRKLNRFLLLASLGASAFLLEGCGSPVKTWAEYSKELESQGEIFDYRQSIPAPIPPEKNFAHSPLLKQLFDYEWNTELTEAKHRAPARLEEIQELLKIDLEDSPEVMRWPSGQRVDLSAWQKSFRKKAVLPKPDKTNKPLKELLEANGVPIGDKAEPPRTWPHPAEPGKAAVDVLQALGVFAEEMTELTRAAGERPLCRFDIKYEATLSAVLPHLLVFRYFSECYALRAVARLAAGDLEGAFSDTEMLFFLADCLADEPMLISQLVRRSLLEMALQPAWEGLAGRKWTSEQLAKLEKHLGGIDLLADCRRSLLSERDLLNHLLETLFKLQGSEKKAPRFFGNLKDKPHWFLDRNRVRINEIYMKFSKHVIDSDARTINLEVAAEQARYLEENKQKLDHLIASIAIPGLNNIARSFGDGQSIVDLARIACLLELHKLEEGSYPEKLAGLDGQLPTDPYSGKAYHYSTLPEAKKTGGYQLYGIGSNLKDDGGRIVLTESGWVEDEEGDIVWRYSPPPTLLKIPKPREK